MIYRQLKGYKYELLKPVGYLLAIEVADVDTPYITIHEGLLSIREHYAWDGPSGPTIDTLSFMRGSLIHDALYQLMREGYLDRHHREYADRVLKEVCLDDGMLPFRAWYVHHAVMMFAGKSAMPRKKPRGKIIDTATSRQGN